MYLIKNVYKDLKFEKIKENKNDAEYMNDLNRAMLRNSFRLIV